jgi:hypothetical protein
MPAKSKRASREGDRPPLPLDDVDSFNNAVRELECVNLLLALADDLFVDVAEIQVQHARAMLTELATDLLPPAVAKVRKFKQAIASCGDS